MGWDTPIRGIPGRPPGCISLAGVCVGWGRRGCPAASCRLAAGAQGWHIVAADETVYAYGWEGQPRWQWRRPPRVERRAEGLIQFALGGWRRLPLVTAQADVVGVSGGAQLRCLDAW